MLSSPPFSVCVVGVCAFGVLWPRALLDTGEIAAQRESERGKSIKLGLKVARFTSKLSLHFLHRPPPHFLSRDFHFSLAKAEFHWALGIKKDVY